MASKKSDPIIISIYNMKGGVSKTTSTYEIGYILSSPTMLNKKVLMIDFDPQADLSTRVIPQIFGSRARHHQFMAMCERIRKVKIRPMRTVRVGSFIFHEPIGPTPIPVRRSVYSVFAEGHWFLEM